MKKQSQGRRAFLKRAGLVAVTVAVPPWVWGCSTPADAQKDEPAGGNDPDQGADPEWKQRADALESDGVLTAAEPGKWDGKAGGHVPEVTFNEGQASVTLHTKHGMSTEHWITAHYVRDQAGKVLGLQEYEGTDKEARVTFALPPGTTEITAYSHCNKHGDWSAESTKTG